jgi:5-methylcytosine-specific restriction endonuclease McrBC GTP-binding regulatory subunit McrB
METLIARLANTQQYNPENKTIIWEDVTHTRWTKVYGNLQPGDNGLFLAKDQLLTGVITTINNNFSIEFKNVDAFRISNDDFLRLDEVTPENISTTKANFHPFLAPAYIDLVQLKTSINNHRFISFYICKEAYQQTVPMQQNDRLVSIYTSNDRLGFLYQQNERGLDKLNNFKKDLFGSKGSTLEELRRLHEGSGKSNNLAAFDRIEQALNQQGYYKFRSFNEYYNIIHNKRLYRGIIDENEIDIDGEKDSPFPLNQILYGPPGTGKTFHTINKALDILNEDVTGFTRKEKTDLFREKIASGQIVFTTFHQSMSYEDFIEGIKPMDPNSGDAYLKYEVKPGILKLLCDRASYKPTTEESVGLMTESEFENTSFYKISLGNTQVEEDDSIYSYCMKESCIALGWGGYNNFTGKSTSEIYGMVGKELGSGSDARFVTSFIHKLKQGDFVVVSFGNYRFRAIAKVTGDYEFRDNHDLDYYQFRKVEWIVKDIDVPVGELYNKQFSQQAFYNLNKSTIKKEYFVKDNPIIQSGAGRNYVLIIDEINRGNVSQIFGELITLIEKEKRKGNDEEIQVMLPYSKTLFGVPNNLYIIGTMNTADRSVEALDTALRRRFTFEEMMPNPGIIATEGKAKDDPKKLEGINLTNLLTIINERIEVLIDRDHKIGHTYFLTVDDLDSLRETFYKNIIPLLQEYFYGDYGKIGLVLGSGFVREKFNTTKAKVQFAPFAYEDKESLQRVVYELIPDSEIDIKRAVTSLMNIQSLPSNEA